MKRFGLLLFCVLMLSGCSLKYNMKEPSLSSVEYLNPGTTATTMTIVDKRSGDDRLYTMGKIGLGGSVTDISTLLSFQNVTDPIGFFSINLEKELNRRGIPVRCVVGSGGGEGVSVEVNRYQIINYRATGFSPWEACHVFAGVIGHGEKRTGIKAYFYNGKVPVWSMDEIEEPCFNIPTSILIKDVASKINKAVFNLRSSDEKVQQLAAEIDADLAQKPEIGPLWKVLELAYTNNQNAMPLLKQYAVQGDELFKSSALSAIGILGPETQFDFLKQRYAETFYNEKYMAAKAIGDIGSEEALAFVRTIKNESIYESEGGLKSVVDLYATP